MSIWNTDTSLSRSCIYHQPTLLHKWVYVDTRRLYHLWFAFPTSLVFTHTNEYVLVRSGLSYLGMPLNLKTSFTHTMLTQLAWGNTGTISHLGYSVPIWPKSQPHNHFTDTVELTTNITVDGVKFLILALLSNLRPHKLFTHVPCKTNTEVSTEW